MRRPYQDEVTSVRPDLSKNRHFGQILKVFGNIWNLHIASGKLLNLLRQFVMLMGKFSFVKVAKFWKIILPSGHTEQREEFVMEFLSQAAPF